MGVTIFICRLKVKERGLNMHREVSLALFLCKHAAGVFTRRVHLAVFLVSLSSSSLIIAPLSWRAFLHCSLFTNAVPVVAGRGSGLACGGRAQEALA